MPRIPLSEGRQLLPQRHDAVHAPQTIAGDFGMDDPRALMNAGDRIRGAGEKIAGAGIAFATELKEQENRLAAAEDRNLLARLGGELENMIRNNPNASDEEKDGWIQGYRQKYEDERRKYTDAMSDGFRKRHDAEIAAVRIHFANTRNQIIAQAKVTRVYEHYKELLKDAALRGDLESYRRLLAEAQGGKVKVFSDGEAERLTMNYDHLADFGAARDAVDANEVDIDRKLVEKDDKGNYKYYSHITVQEREQLRRTAVVKRHDLETEQDTAYLAGLNDGSIVDTPEDLKGAYDRKEISAAQYNRRLAWVIAIAQKRDGSANAEWARAVESGEIEASPEQVERDFELGTIPSRAQRDFRLDYLKKREAASDKARHARQEQLRQEQEREQKAQTKLRSAEKKAFLFDLDMTTIASGAYANTLQRETLFNMAQNLFGYDPDTLGEVRKAIIKKCEDGLNKRDIADLPGGAEVLQFIEQEYRDGSGFKNLKWDPHGSQKDNSQTFMKAKYQEILVAARDMLQTGSTTAEVIEHIRKQVQRLNDGKTYRILSPIDEDARGGADNSLLVQMGGYSIGEGSFKVGASKEKVEYMRAPDGRLLRKVGDKISVVK